MVTETRRRAYGSPQRPKPALHPRPCREFAKFQQLPAELRLMIWEFSITPRVVVACPQLVVTSCKEWPNPMDFTGRPTPSNPAILSVNSESRRVALRTYGFLTIKYHARSCHVHVTANLRDTIRKAKLLRPAGQRVVICPIDILAFHGRLMRQMLPNWHFARPPRVAVISVQAIAPWRRGRSKAAAAAENLNSIGRVAIMNDWCSGYDVNDQWHDFPEKLNGDRVDLDSIFRVARASGDTAQTRLQIPRRVTMKGSIKKIEQKRLLRVRAGTFEGSLEEWSESYFRGEAANQMDASKLGHRNGESLWAFELLPKPQETGEKV